MAAALAKVLRGGCSRASFHASIPAISGRLLQGSSPAAHAAHMGRLIHTGPQNSFPFGRRGVLSQEQKLVKIRQFSSNSNWSSFIDGLPDGLPWSVLVITGGMSIAYMTAYLVESFWKRYTEEDEYSVSLVDDSASKPLGNCADQ